MRTLILLLLWLGYPFILFAQPGSPVLSFGNAGFVSTSFGSSQALARGMVIQPDGKIVLVGYTTTSTGVDMAIARYNADGTPDSSFDEDGLTTLDVFYESEANAVVLQPDGKILVAGYARNQGGNSKLCIARFTSDGFRDKQFNLDGYATGPDKSTANAIALQADGKIVATGSINRTQSRDIIVIRFDTNGQFDKPFNGGYVTIDYDNNKGNEEARSIIIQPDQKMVIAANINYTTSPSSILTLRLRADGIPDSSFAGTGIKLSQLNGEVAATSIARQPDGKYLVGGSFYNGSTTQFLILRYKPEGDIDLSFDADGSVTTPFLATYASAEAISIQPDNKIVATGYTIFGPLMDFALARYRPDGTLDDTFGANGKTTTDILGQDRIHCMKLDGNRLYTGGIINNETFGLAAYQLGNVVLPLRLIDLTAGLETNSVLLKWNTQSENNVSHFEIEFGVDAQQFARIGEVAAGNDPNGKAYSFSHTSPQGSQLYYRLKMVDDDGYFTYSKTVMVRLNDPVAFRAFPNPANNILHIQLKTLQAGTISCRIADLTGKVLLSRSFPANGNTWSTSLDLTSFPAGYYFLIINDGVERRVKMFMKR